MFYDEELDMFYELEEELAGFAEMVSPEGSVDGANIGYDDYGYQTYYVYLAAGWEFDGKTVVTARTKRELKSKLEKVYEVV